jgi:hypothetical protein
VISATAIFERLRGILHEGEIDKRVQYMIEVAMEVRKAKFKDNPMIPEGLDLVEEDDQITHFLSLDDDDITAENQLGMTLFRALECWQCDRDAGVVIFGLAVFSYSVIWCSCLLC